MPNTLPNYLGPANGKTTLSRISRVWTSKSGVRARMKRLREGQRHALWRFRFHRELGLPSSWDNAGMSLNEQVIARERFEKSPELAQNFAAT